MDYITVSYGVISVSALVGFLFGALWYSPLLFLDAWLFGEGFTRASVPKRSLRYRIQVSLYSFIAHIAIAGLLALLFDLLQVGSLKAAVSLGALLALGFIVTVKYIDMLYTLHGEHWNRRAQVKFLVASGYYVLVIMLMSSLLFLLSHI
jgi:hypothetical protein